VVGKDVDHDVIQVAHADELEDYARRAFRVADPHWIADPPQRSNLAVKIRHGERLDPCTISDDTGGPLTVEFKSAADPGVAPGQFAALYDGEECLGGGVIE
jgi:tRNA-specific 2-thiouridylase